MADQSGSFRRRLAAAHADLIALRPAIEARRPWRPGDVEPGAGEDAWGGPEILAHLAEMLPYWLGQAELVLEGSVAGGVTTLAVSSGEPAAFGRVEADELRIARVERDRWLPLRELFDRIESDVARWDRRLAAFGAGELATVGRHPRRGDMTVEEIVERFAVGHFEDHVAQMRRVLGAGGTEP